MATTSAQVQQLYVGLLGRAADQAGLNYWLGELNATPAKITLENLRANIVNTQPEYKAIFGNLSRVDTVTKIYNNLFGRAPDAGGLAYWTTGAGSNVNIDQLTLAFINGASAADTKALTNKALVAEVYTSTAGGSFVAADAAAIIAGVTTDTGTIGSALNKLTDGSLSGIAVPVAVAQIKAVEAANAAITANVNAKVADLVKINADLVAAAKAIDPADTTVETIATSPADTNAQKFDKLTDAAGITKEFADARKLLNDKTTGELQLVADTTAKTLADTTAALKQAGNGYIGAITTYQAAVNALAAVKDVAKNVVDQAQATLVAQVAFATPAQKAALVAALNATGVVGLKDLKDADFADAAKSAASVAKIYDVLKDVGTTAQVLGQVDAALNTYAGYNSVKTAAAQAKDFAVKTEAVTAAEAALKAVGNADLAETAYIDAVKPATDASKAVADSKVLDALEAQYKSILDGNKALTDAANTAVGDLGPNVKLITAASTVDAGTSNDVFYFGAAVTGDKDMTITKAGALGNGGVDSIYVGSDYVKGTGTATAAGGITGGNDGVKEVFFFQKGNDTYVVVEAKSYGSSTVTDYATLATGSPDAAVIKLSGVGIEKVSFANGVVSVA